MVRREVAADRPAEARIGAVHERLAVDGVHERAADARIVEGLARVVEPGHRLAFRIAGDGREARILPQVGEEFGSADVREGIDVAGLHRRHLRLRVVDEAERDALELHLVLLPIVGIAHEFDPVAPHPGLELEGTRADGARLVVLGGLRRHDHRVAPAEIVEEVARRLLELDHDGRRIRRLDRVDGREDLLLRIGRVRRPRTVERELHVGRIEGRPVMEFHARLEAERVGAAVRRDLPAFRQERLHLAVPVDAHESLVEIDPGHFADRDGRRNGRIEARRLDRHADHERRLGGLGGCEAGGKEEGGNESTLRHVDIPRTAGGSAAVI